MPDQKGMDHESCHAWGLGTAACSMQYSTEIEIEWGVPATT